MTDTTMTDTPPGSRSHEHVVRIQATPERVWRAITDPTELTQWFPLEAAGDPKAGGELIYRWGEFEGRCEILRFEPARHLSMTWMMTSGEGDGDPIPLVVDWTLTPDESGTTLRLVHSGFGPDASFDDEFDGTRRGWKFELNSLRYWLERHDGRDRKAIWITRPTACSADEMLRRMRAPNGALQAGDLESLNAGDGCTLEFAGTELRGQVIASELPEVFSMEVDSHGGGLFRFGHDTCDGTTIAHVWMSTWDHDPAEIDALDARWRRAFDGFTG